MDAVYAMAHALHKMVLDKCGPNARELCTELRPAPSGRELLKYIRNVSFIGNIILYLKKKETITEMVLRNRSTRAASPLQ